MSEREDLALNEIDLTVLDAERAFIEETADCPPYSVALRAIVDPDWDSSLNDEHQTRCSHCQTRAKRIRQQLPLAEHIVRLVSGANVSRATLRRRRQRAQDVKAAGSKSASSVSLEDMMREYERALIVQALIGTAGNQRRAALILGITASALHRKMVRLEIPTKRSMPQETVAYNEYLERKRA